MYMLKRIEDGKYVTTPGSKFSYTENMRRARIYQTRKAAEADKCGNETIVTVESQLHLTHF